MKTEQDVTKLNALSREITAIDAKLAFLTSSGYDEARVEAFRDELLDRRRELEYQLAELGF